MISFLKANLLKSELIEIDKQLSNCRMQNTSWLLCVKSIFVAISNLVDYELTVRILYKENKELSIEYNRMKKELEFAKYLRNKFVGHITDELINKSIEWKPQIRYSLERVDEDDIMFIFNIFILETAINTYVDSNGKHKIFDSETDLAYPPDTERFLKYLTLIVRSAISYLINLTNVLKKDIEMLDPSEQKLEHWIAAAETEFKFIKK